ncbi:MAG: phosphoribosylformylglycinamidine cyclo-ligase [Patescibacteria group bacterium]
MGDGSEAYKEAGVDLNAADRLADEIKPIAKKTYTELVRGDIGGFSGAFSLKPFMSMEHPVAVSSTDGVGTKLKIAFMANKHDTVGIDLVAMCVNDLLAGGAKPLFFLDYISIGKLDLDIVKDIVAGIANGCIQAQCSLIGGETAEMPGFYGTGEYDMCGFVVGMVDESKSINGPESVEVGDQLIGFPSSGLHSNGFSLVRKIFFEELGLAIDSYVEDLGRTLGEELLEPTKIYAEVVKLILLNFKVNGFVNITGGGWPDNFKRILPPNCTAVIEKEKVPRLPIFSFLQEAGKLKNEEMQRTFNNGLGFAAIVNKFEADNMIGLVKKNLGINLFHIGEVVERKDEPIVVV